MFKEKLSLLPNKPGCYMMKNKDGVIIYVGKAKNLKKRVSSYFNRTHTGKTAKLVSEIANFDYVVVGSETESLILEINLIKKHDPKYNILLRDDKSYPYIELTNEKIPRLVVIRNVNKKKNKTGLFGPYPNVTAARNTVNLLNRMYPLKKCKNGKDLCLYYHIHECLGYCKKEINKDVINNMRNEILSYLKGDHKYLNEKIISEMNKYSEQLNFEKAKELKDLLDSVNITLKHQNVEISDLTEMDVFGYSEYKGYLCIVVFFIRNGKIQERHFKVMPIIEEIEEQITNYIATFYDKGVLLPKEIVISDNLNIDLIKDYLNIKVLIPQKGDKKKILDMACNNALITLKEKFELINRDEERTTLANEELKNILKLNKLDRIEIFDNSNLFGNYNVSGMVVYKDGKPSKNDYRKFKISFDKNDDYNTMREVIYRRYFRVLKDDLERPDLIIVDGGKGQINVAQEVIDSLCMNIMVVGLKKDDKHSTNALIKDNEEIPINKESNLFYYLERMQDEVHNFTINYHKQIRSKGAISSILDNVTGIGEKRKKDLIKKYKNVTNIKEASIEELDKILPHDVSINLQNFLKGLDT